jgi:thiol-disulfide isomerase/thioredoxin
MIALGPSAKRPPHIWLELPVLSSRLFNAAILACALSVAGCDRQSGETAQPQESAAKTKAGVIDRSHKGAAMPEFVLKDPAGKELRLSSLAGKPVLINLWATWCAPCVAELPMLDGLAKQGRVRVLTISQDMSDPAKVADFLKSRGGDGLEPWLDPANDLSFHYGTGTLPTTILYDAAGKEVWRFVGENDWAGPEAAKLLAEAS